MKTQGFTLTEVVITISILAILTVVAIPSFQESIIRNKVQKTSDLIVEIIAMSQSEALQRNIKIFVSAVNGNLCIGIAAGGCDIRNEPLINGITLSAPDLILSPFYGTPNPAPAIFTVTYSGVSQTVSVNKLGIISVGPLS